MSELQDRCVLLKNLPHTCEERAVRDTLDFAHGDFRYQDKYEKIHRHVEFGDDVRWIVLFKSKKDAIDCISNGPWVSNAIRGGCMVNPDYCSGCIIPDEWFEDTSGDDEDWDMGDSFRTQDSNTETSEDFMNSFVNVENKKTLIHDDDTDSDEENYAQEIAMVPPFGGTKKPVPAKRSKSNHKSDVSEDAFNATVTFDNQFESLIDEIDSADILESRNSKEGMDIVKGELVSENTSRNTSPVGSNGLSEERIPTNELFGSGDVNLKGKGLEDKAAKKTKTDLDKTVSISDRRNSNVEMDTVKCEADFKNMAEDHISSSELFGSGYGKSKEKKMEEVSINRATENDNITVKKRLSNTEMDTGRYTCISERKSDDSYKDMYTETDKSSVLSDNQKKTLTHHSKYVGGDYSDDGKISSVSSTELFESQDEEQDARMSSVDKSDKSKFKYAKRHEKKEEEIVYNGKFNHHTTSETKADGDNNKLYNKSMSASVRSADLFGNGQESMEFQYRKEQDNFEEANSEQVVGNKRGDSGTEEEKTEDSNRQSVNILPAASDNGHEAINSYQGSQFPHQGMPHVPLGWPYPFYGPMIPNSHNATYGSNMMGQSQPQPNITSPGNPSSAWNMNPMYQMPYHWPMPLQLNDKGQPVYHIPFPGVIPPMHLDEKGNPLQNPGLMNPFYLMPYVPPGHNLYQTPSHQRSTDEKSHPTSEGYLSPRTFNIEHNETEKSNSRIKEESKPLKYDRSNSLNDAKEYIYDVPYSTHRSLTRQTSAVEITCDHDINRPYSLATESKTTFVPDKDSDNSKQKTWDVEEHIYDEIDDDKLKSLRSSENSRPPALPPKCPPLKPPISCGRPHTMKKNLNIYDDNELEDEMEENDQSKSEGTDECCRTILVTGFSSDVSTDALELYFENKKKTGGGEIVNATINEKKMEAVIEFKKHEDAMEVIKRALSGEKFTLSQCHLHVSEYHPPPLDPYKVFIKGIANTTTNECITNFIAAQMHLEPISVIPGETPGTVLVSFKEAIDVARLREVCDKRKCEGKHWNIVNVELVRSIKVEKLSPTTSIDSLSLYFENTRRSQGGEVESVKFREDREDFIVTFKNSDDAKRVCQTEHKVNGETILVALFYPCLELDEDFIVNIPPPIQLDDQDDYIIKFIINSELYRGLWERRIKQNYGEIVWPPADEAGNVTVQINCNVDEKDIKGHVKVKNWTENCLSIVKEMTNKFSVERSRNVAVEVWSELKTRLREIEVPHPESVAVFLESSNCVVVMVGEKQHVRSMALKIQEIINEIEKRIQIENQTVTKKRKFMTYEMALYRASKIEGSLKKILDEIEIDNEKKEIMFKGSQKDVDAALEKVENMLKSFVKRPIPGISRQMINLLFKREARDLVKRKLIEKKVIGIWDVIKGTNLIMYSKNEKDLDIAVEILQSSVIMDSIFLDDEKTDILNSVEGKAKVAEFEQNYQGCLSFEITSAEMLFVCVSDIHQEIKDEFTKLFDLHSVISKFISTEPGVLSYIITHKKRDIENIERQYQRLSVMIEIKDSRRRSGFIVKGKKDGCKLAIGKLQPLIDSVVRKDHIVSWPGFDKFILSSEGKASLQSIEILEKCILKVSSENLSSAFESTIHMNAAAKDPEMQADTTGRISKVVKIGTLASEQVDVIVNSTNSNLDMQVGAISKTLLKGGGDVIARECKEKYFSGIKPGEVAVTTGGALSCNELYHGVLVKWDNGQGLAEKVMVNFIKCCLTLASTSGYSSIAFPALGTGAMGFPADVVAKTMFETVDAFEAKNPDTSLKMVRFVVWSEDRITAKAFQEIDSSTNFRRSSGSGVRRSYHQSEAAENIIVKSKGYSTTIGPVSINIVKDDLTKFTSGAIVNSTMEDLNLNTGAISRAILTAAGSSIQNEALQKTQQFLKNGFVVTSPGRLLCSNIIHVKARNSLAGWTESIKKCLMEAERLGLNSIAFPALGTGGKGISADRMAKTMINAFQDYIKSPDFQKCLKTIGIVIFEEKMVDIFILETKAELDTEKPAKWKSYLPDLKFWEKKTPEVVVTPKVTLHIYCGSEYLVDLIVRKIEEIRQEKEVFAPRVLLENMDDKLKLDLRRFGQTLGVKVVVDKSRIKVMGYGRSVQNAYTQLDGYIEKISADLRKGTSAVKLPAVWSKMKLTDPTKIEVLLPTSSDYKEVCQRFLRETGFMSTCIVKIERIQNPTLFIQYAGKKKQMEILNSGGKKVEQVLWHGTKSTAVDNIKSKGFDRNYNSGSSHGVGVYFAVKAAMSAGGYCRPDGMGHKHIFLAHVLTGEYCVGRGGIRVPPLYPGSNSRTYDSTTDNVQAPNFFVIFHDAQAYPSYLITFT